MAVAAIHDRGICSGRDLEVEGAFLASLRSRNNRTLPTTHNSQSAHRIWHVRREETDREDKEQATSDNFETCLRLRSGDTYVLGLCTVRDKRHPETTGAELCVEVQGEMREGLVC